MRKDQCFFCHSRACYDRIVSSVDNGKTYDEVACRRHITDLEKHSDEKAPKVMKLFVSSTGKQKRGEDLKPMLEELEEMEKRNATTKTT
ncbi:hypothetical protein [Aminipila sp.]|uniref:hypothetical protein n=1 Tax=Aminipila sp. TaxID=2060095 RepID=UPI0028974553|nr:hypothetical protein [Aminipila sp.]